MKSRKGFTFVELLVAMAILGTVLALAYGVIISGAKQQREHEALTSSQAKLRRVLEVVSQDVRSSVFGNISNRPYTSTESAISFTLLVGGAGYQIMPQNTSGTLTGGTISVVGRTTNTAPNLSSGQVLLLNGDGKSVIFPSGNLTRNSSTGYWQMTYPSSCGVFSYTPNTLAFRVNTLGYSLDAASKTLFFRSASANPQPLAFDISEFKLTYVYVNRITGALSERTTPYLVNGNPQKTMPVTSGGVTTNWVLSQVRVLITTTEQSNNKQIERSYQSSIDLGAAQTLDVKEVKSCV